MIKQKVYLVGAGQGASLITVRGLEILRQADVVIYDYLIDKSLLDEARPGAELICSDSLGKKKHLDKFSKSQDKINDLIVRKALDDKKVIRLKSGDPAIFSRLSQELEAITKNKIEFEIVPGVTAASSASCLNGVPLTDRRFASSVIFLTGHEDPAKKHGTIDWQAVASTGTIVIYMAVENIGSIANTLINKGKPKNTPAMAVANAGFINQRTCASDLGNIADAVKKSRITAPAIFIIGRVVGFNKKFNWFNKNKRILYTGISKERFFLKGNYFHLPLIKIIPIASYKEFDGHLKNIDKFDWIILTSRYGVKYFFERLNALGIDSRALKGIKIAVIGSSTKKCLKDHGVFADLVPKNESSAGLLAEFKKIDIKGRKIFMPRSDLSDKNLTGGLQSLRAKVTASVAYKNIMPKALPDLDLPSFNEIMFTSPSGVRNFIKRYGPTIPAKVKVSCIGSVTLKEAVKWRLV